jgi:hypothetical protein
VSRTCRHISETAQAIARARSQLARWASSRGESHPPALSEPDVTVSRHPAPIIRPWAALGRQ